MVQPILGQRPLQGGLPEVGGLAQLALLGLREDWLRESLGLAARGLQCGWAQTRPSKSSAWLS